MLTNYQLYVILASGFYILAMKADGFEALAFLAISFYFWISKLIVPTTKE